MGLENPRAKQLGCMIMAASNRIDHLWSKCTPAMLLDWLSKTQATITDKIDVLKTVRESSGSATCPIVASEFSFLIP